jgi:hypothetical protein
MKKVIQSLALAVLLASWLFPYFVAYSYTGHRGSDVGFHFLFSKGHQTERVDFARLFLTDLCIVAVAAGALRWVENERR